jgi:hypothetical protein
VEGYSPDQVAEEALTQTPLDHLKRAVAVVRLIMAAEMPLQPLELAGAAVGVHRVAQRRVQVQTAVAAAAVKQFALMVALQLL